MKKIFTIVIALLAVISSTSAQWSIVGSAGLSSSVANYTVMAVDNNGIPYIAYSDNSVGNKLSVRKYNSGWSTVGSTGVSSSSVSHISMAIDGSNNIYVSYRDDNVSGKVTVLKYNGSSWSTMGSAGISDGSSFFTSIATTSGGTVYVAYQDNTVGGKISVKKWSGSSWSYVGSKGFTSSQADYVKLGIDGSGNIGVAYRDNNTQKARAMYFNGSSWSDLGQTGISSGSIGSMAIAIDGNNVPYIAYKDNNNSSKATVQKFNGSSWVVVGSAGFTANQVDGIDLAIDGNNTPYIAFKDAANNWEATVMSFNGSSWSIVTAGGFSASQIEYPTIAIAPDNTIYVGFRDNAVGQKATVMKHAGAASASIVWTGNSSTTWGNSANWNPTNVPSTTDNVKIPGGRSRYPNITSGTSGCKNIEISSGASVKVSGGKLEIAGTITNAGTFDAENGYIVMKGNAAQIIPTGTFVNNTIEELELDNSNGCTLGDTIKITDTYYPTSGVLTTNNKLVLKSDANGTARIAGGSTSGNYITGKVTVEQYIKGRRAYRFLAHPFKNAIALGQLMDDIDITGTGGTSNGFTQVQVNNPSSFWFDVTTADGTTAGNNPGWKAFTNTTSASWEPYEMARIMIRGAKGQGLTSNNYTPQSVTLDMTEEVNQGDRWVSMAKGGNSTFVICGNPFPSPVNLKYVSRYNVGSSFCVWDPYMGNRGAYVAKQFSYDYILPAQAAFVTNVYSGSVGYVKFTEASKSSSTPAAVLKGTSVDFNLEMTVVDTAGIRWDQIIVDFDTIGMTVQDTFDMVKLNNPDVDFYTLSADNQPLSVDVRPYEDQKTIKLGFMPYMENRFAFNVSNMSIPAHVKLYLHDKFLNKTEEIVPGFEYWFDATSDTTTYGEDRFSINMVGKLDTSVTVNTVPVKLATRMQLIPNPATDVVKVSFDKLQGDAIIRLTDMSGKVAVEQQVNSGEGSVVLNLQTLPAGMYLVNMQGKNVSISTKLIKQ